MTVGGNWRLAAQCGLDFVVVVPEQVVRSRCKIRRKASVNYRASGGQMGECRAEKKGKKRVATRNVWKQEKKGWRESAGMRMTRPFPFECRNARGAKWTGTCCGVTGL
jgi:hypothetical protein